MIIRDAVLETVCGITSRLPANTQPEFAFCGKSNVGKSSLINALMNRKSLARTSSTPGKTQTINYYHINDAFFYVDLPGYGFAKASEKVKAQWGKLIEDYLHQSRAIRAVFLLVDIRHVPGDNDRLMFQWITDHGYTPLIIATALPLSFFMSTFMFLPPFSDMIIPPPKRGICRKRRAGKKFLSRIGYLLIFHIHGIINHIVSNQEMIKCQSSSGRAAHFLRRYLPHSLPAALWKNLTFSQ